MPKFFKPEILEAVYSAARTAASGDKEKELFIVKNIMVHLEQTADFPAEFRRCLDKVLQDYKEQYYEQKDFPHQIFPSDPQNPSKAKFFRWFSAPFSKKGIS